MTSSDQLKQVVSNDELLEVNHTNYSLRKILGEDGWQIYCSASDKVKGITRIKVRMDLVQMEIGLARLDEKFKRLHADSSIPPSDKSDGIFEAIL